jgi:hypothetical protein
LQVRVALQEEGFGPRQLQLRGPWQVRLLPLPVFPLPALRIHRV